jgi:hypothetical protein
MIASNVSPGVEVTFLATRTIPFRGFPVGNHVATSGFTKPKVNWLQTDGCLFFQFNRLQNHLWFDASDWVHYLEIGVRYLADTVHFLWALRPTHALFSEYWECYRGVKWPECETDRLTICSRGYDKHWDGTLLHICVQAYTDKHLLTFGNILRFQWVGSAQLRRVVAILGYSYPACELRNTLA